MRRPDGRSLITGCDDGIARQWSAGDDRELLHAIEHDSPIVAALFSSDGRGLRLAELLACRRIDEAGGLVDLPGEELRSRWMALRPGSRR